GRCSRTTQSGCASSGTPAAFNASGVSLSLAPASVSPVRTGSVVPRLTSTCGPWVTRIVGGSSRLDATRTVSRVKPAGSSFNDGTYVMTTDSFQLSNAPAAWSTVNPTMSGGSSAAWAAVGVRTRATAARATTARATTAKVIVVRQRRTVAWPRMGSGSLVG